MSWSESSQTPISAILIPPASSHQTLQVMQRHSVNTWDGQFGMKHHRDTVNLEPESPNSCFQQEKDVGLVKMLPRFLHHSQQGERMTTATADLFSPLRALSSQSSFCLLPEVIPILTCSQTPKEPGDPQKSTVTSVPTSSLMTSRPQLSQG